MTNTTKNLPVLGERYSHGQMPPGPGLSTEFHTKLTGHIVNNLILLFLRACECEKAGGSEPGPTGPSRWWSESLPKKRWQSAGHFHLERFFVLLSVNYIPPRPCVMKRVTFESNGGSKLTDATVNYTMAR